MEENSSLKLVTVEEHKDVDAISQHFLVKENCIIEEKCDLTDTKFLNFSSQRKRSEVTDLETRVTRLMPSGEVFEIPKKCTYSFVLHAGTSIFIFTAKV